MVDQNEYRIDGDSFRVLGLTSGSWALRPELPLILCGKCKQKIAREKKEDPNHGHIFYKCLDPNVSVSSPVFHRFSHFCDDFY